MASTKQNPAAANCGAPKTDLAGCLIVPEDTKSLHLIQAHKLTRRCAISFAMAITLVSYLYGDAA